MTRLACIRSNHLPLICSICGHCALVPVSTAIEALNGTETVQNVVKHARCSQCLVKGTGLYQIVYVGESWDALEGARV